VYVGEYIDYDFMVINPSNQPVIDRIVVTGLTLDNTADFEIIRPKEFPQVLDPDPILFVTTIRFHPVDVGVRTGWLVYMSNAANAPTACEVQGLGLRRPQPAATHTPTAPAITDTPIVPYTPTSSPTATLTPIQPATPTTSTPTATPTSVPTATPTTPPSPTHTSTPTHTPSPTHTPTLTLSPSPTATATQTATSTPTPPVTPTSTPTLKADFGDAPDPPYPTRLQSDGPYHQDFTQEWLGKTVDGEPDARFPDSDDGVVFVSRAAAGQTPWYRVGQPMEMLVTISTSGSGSMRYGPQTNRRLYLRAWIDWNRDGRFDPADQSIEWSGGPGVPDTEGKLWPSTLRSWTIRFRPSAFKATGTYTWVRFRLSYGSPVPPTGAAAFGEVEDYPVGVFWRDP